jgi:hypothetical protein
MTPGTRAPRNLRNPRYPLLLLLTLLAGCGPSRIGGSTPVDQVIDSLRQDNQSLTAHVQDQDRRLALQRQQIDALQQQLAATQPALQGTDPADLPRLVGVEFDAYSGLITTPAGTILRLYLRPFDQRGRFLALWAQASAQAVWLRPGQPPTVLAQAVFPPADFDRTYRAGFTGTHYTLDLPLPALPPGATDAAVKLAVTDAATGITVQCQATMPLSPPPSPATQPRPAP